MCPYNLLVLNPSSLLFTLYFKLWENFDMRLPIEMLFYGQLWEPMIKILFLALPLVIGLSRKSTDNLEIRWIIIITIAVWRWI